MNHYYVSQKAFFTYLLINTDIYIYYNYNTSTYTIILAGNNNINDSDIIFDNICLIEKKLKNNKIFFITFLMEKQIFSIII